MLGQRISGWGSLLGAPFTIASGALLLSCDQPAVTYATTANRYLVVYRHRNLLDFGSAISGRSYLPDGTAEGAAFDIAGYSNTTDPAEPDVAYNRSRNEALAVWQETYPSTGDLDIHARRIQFAGGAATLGSSFALALSIQDELLPAVAAIPTLPGEGQYLVTYQVDPDDINHDIVARAVSGAGVVGVFTTLANTGWSELRPAVAGCESNRQFLVTWVWVPVITPPAVMQVQARTVALDGTPLHATVTAAGGQVFDAAVAAGEVCTHLIAFDDNATMGTFSRGIYGNIWGERVFLPLVLRGGITMSFLADRTTITLGECVTLSWLVEGAANVYLDGTPVPASGTSYQCPIMNQEYELSAVDTLGNWVRKSIIIAVQSGY